MKVVFRFIIAISVILLLFARWFIEFRNQNLEIEKMKVNLAQTVLNEPIKIIDSNYNLIEVNLLTKQELEKYDILIEKMIKNQKKLTKIIDNITDNNMRASFFSRIKNWFN